MVATRKQVAGPTADAAEIQRALEIFHQPGDVVELRMLDIPGRGRPFTAAGYFRDFQAAATAAVEFDNEYHPAGCYFVLNQCNPALHARSPEQLSAHPKATAGDADILRRRWLLVDLDPPRPAGISSTDAELAAAQQIAEQVHEYLDGQHFAEPIHAASGNGIHLLYPLDLVADEASKTMVSSILKVLGAEFTHESGKSWIDISVSNAARIVKLYGTVGRKGHSTDDRPHRQSKLTYVPDYLGSSIAERQGVPLERLQAVAALDVAPQQQPAQRSRQITVSGVPVQIGRNGDNRNGRLMVGRWLADRGCRFHEKQLPDGRTAYVLSQCPFDQQHGSSGEVAIYQNTEGKLGAKCMHAGCAGRGWQQFKEAIGPPSHEHYEQTGHERGGDSRNGSGTTPKNEEAKQPRNAQAIEVYTAADLANGEFGVEYLVPHILAELQPTIIGGASKSMKTSIGMDLSLSLAAGAFFLGMFKVARPVRVAVLSGESGLSVLAETSRRIATAANIDLRSLGNTFIVSPTVPRIDTPAALGVLEQFIDQHQPGAILLDPAYLIFSGAADRASNVFSMGDVLFPLAQLCQERECMPIICHHSKKRGGGDEKYEPMDLETLAFSGWCEFARQWLLVSRREPFEEGTGLHRLWLRVGGSAGHSGLWGVDINEGHNTAAEGREWRVEVVPAKDVRKSTADRKQEAKQRQAAEHLEDDRGLIVRLLVRWDRPATKTQIKEYSHLGTARLGAALDSLITDDTLAEFVVVVGNGQKHPGFGIKDWQSREAKPKRHSKRKTKQPDTRTQPD